MCQCSFKSFANISILTKSQTKFKIMNTENIFSFLFQNSSDAIFLLDLSGKIIEVNQTASRMLKYERSELIGLDIKRLKSPKFKQMVNSNIEEIIKNKLHTYETEHVKKTGEICPVEMKSRFVEYEGKPAIISVARNITQRKEFEKKLMQTIIKTEEKERKRFAADLHDGLSPILSTIKLYADLLKKNNLKSAKKTEILNDIDELSELAISTAKEVANNITPSILHDFGLATAVNEFCKYVANSKTLSIDCKTQKYCSPENKLIDSILYQAVKELINNTLKHSDAKKITIEIKNINHQIILYYKDDGKGFDVANALHNPNGLGLNNIVNKIKTIKGSCDFYSPESGGLIFVATIKE